MLPTPPKTASCTPSTASPTSWRAGATLGIVGESGSGKTVSALSLLGLTRSEGARVSGRILLRRARPARAATSEDLRALRGNEIAMIFQDPLSSLHPALPRRRADRRGDPRAPRAWPSAQARARTVELLELVGIPDAARRADAYPHELSGGMRQRAMIAMALANEPKLLIADEPTTALDVTVQAQILALLARLQRELAMAIVLVTHDLGVVAEMADEIAVMYAGRIVERASAQRIFAAPEHPYTWGLLRSIPTLYGPREELLTPIPGNPPSPLEPPSGCHFHPRCPYAQPEHARIDPPLAPVASRPGQSVACLLAPELRRRLWARCAPARPPRTPGPRSACRPRSSPASASASARRARASRAGAAQRARRRGASA